MLYSENTSNLGHIVAKLQPSNIYKTLDIYLFFSYMFGCMRQMLLENALWSSRCYGN